MKDLLFILVTTTCFTAAFAAGPTKLGERLYAENLAKCADGKILVAEDFNGPLRESETESPTEEKTGYCYAMGPDNGVPMFLASRDPKGEDRLCQITEGASKWIRFRDVEVEKQHFTMPYYSWRFYHERRPTQGSLFISFDIQLPEKEKGSIVFMARDRGVPNPYAARNRRRPDIFRIHFLPAVTHFPGGKSPAAAGEWRHIEVNLPINDKDRPMSVTLIDAKNGRKSFQTKKYLPSTTVTELLFSLDGNPHAQYEMDNLLIAIRP